MSSTSASRRYVVRTFGCLMTVHDSVAAMKLFLEDQVEANKLIDGLMPSGLKDLVKAADPNLAEHR